MEIAREERRRQRRLRKAPVPGQRRGPRTADGFLPLSRPWPSPAQLHPAWNNKNGTLEAKVISTAI